MTQEEAVEQKPGNVVYYCDSARGTVKAVTASSITIRWDSGTATEYLFADGQLPLLWTPQEAERLAEERAVRQASR
jgi:hypothetical protein